MNGHSLAGDEFKTVFWWQLHQNFNKKRNSVLL
jgi:hypothetical protein